MPTQATTPPTPRRTAHGGPACPGSRLTSNPRPIPGGTLHTIRLAEKLSTASIPHKMPSGGRKRRGRRDGRAQPPHERARAPVGAVQRHGARGNSAWVFCGHSHGQTHSPRGVQGRHSPKPAIDDKAMAAGHRRGVDASGRDGSTSPSPTGCTRIGSHFTSRPTAALGCLAPCSTRRGLPLTLARGGAIHQS